MRCSQCQDLCRQLDITAIETLQTEGFEAALVTHTVRSSGAILVAEGRTRQRRRFSIAHELGHFLIPAHRVPADGMLQCTSSQLKMTNQRGVDFRARMEIEANQFAAMLLMPPPIVRLQLRQLVEPNLPDLFRLAQRFDVSKEAMARAFVVYARQSLAVIVVKNGAVLWAYRDARTFPWLEVKRGDPVPADSVWHHRMLKPGDHSDLEECEAVTWLSSAKARKVEALTEQALDQRNGFGLILLHAELRDEEGDGLRATDEGWR
ncbi:MAG: ImmA/IrrE family metallo-endopeptidase [Pseudomonadota bacterium]